MTVEEFMEVERYMILMEIYMKIVFGNMENQLVLAKHIIKMENCEAKDIKNIIIMREYSSGIMKVGNYI